MDSELDQRNRLANPVAFDMEYSIEMPGQVESETVPIDILDRNSYASEVTFRNDIMKIMKEYKMYLEEAKEFQLGYPINHAEESDVFNALHTLQDYYINNVGDPNVSMPFGSHSHRFEMGVLRWFRDLWGLEAGELHGYVTTGGSESNIQALFVARETYPDAIVYITKEAHFSVYKACHLLRIETVVIDSDDRGEMDYIHFENALHENYGRKAIVCLTIGTTMKGAIDVPQNAIKCLHRAGYNTGDDVFIHLDAALSGIFIPLLDSAPSMSFKDHPEISSISVSGHKFLGSPIPCGVLLMRKKYVENIGDNVEYIFCKDVTLTCSRNGHAALYLWLLLSQLGKKQVKQDAERCIRYAQEVQTRLSSGGIESWINPWSITVVAKKPNISFVKHWQLAVQGDYCHIVVMPHMKRETLHFFVDSFISSYNASGIRSDTPGSDLHSREMKMMAMQMKQCITCAPSNETSQHGCNHAVSS